MSEIRIVEYQRKYAAALAKMWNLSADSWGGFDSLETEESVAAENEGSDNLNIWLALDGEEVVGYCSFSEYREDEGASYIPLLNVRPDYHSKKVGKALVLKAVEQACQSRWPRLDLYTWPGNTKAVPLYKKCGFFWENRDDTTHLMNFIPLVMHTEAAADFFHSADWYTDSTRDIEVKPDGRKDGDYEYMGYHWQRGEKMLKMEFERRGRGLRLMETEDWLISAAVEDLKLVFGRTYKVVYRIVNKTGRPLEVSLKGINDKIVSFALERTVTVTDETEVQGEFQVGEITEEQSEWRTHPGVCAEMMINGKKALFKVGILPKFPALIKAVLPEGDYCSCSQGQFFVNIENNFKESAVFSFSLPRADFVHLEKTEYDIRLQSQERLAVPVDFSLQGLGLLAGNVEIIARPESGGTIQYSRELTVAFTGSGASFGGETDDRWFVANGRFIMTLEKFNNALEVRSLDKELSSTSFMRPQLGLPYSVEFAKTKPVRVEHRHDGNAANILAVYQSKEYPGIEILRQANLQADGLAWQSWTIANRGSKPFEKLWFRTMLRHPLNGAVIPMQGKFIEARDGYGEFVANFPLNELEENWIFSHTDTPRGLCWSPDQKALSTHGTVCLDEDLGTLAPGQEAEIKPVYLSLGTFRDWRKFRNFAMEKIAETELAATDSLEVRINGGNPFVSQDYELAVLEHKNIPFEGVVTAQAEKGIYALHTASISDKKANLTLPVSPVGSIDLIKLEVDTEGIVFQRSAAVFGIGGEIRTESGRQDSLDTLNVDNGIVQFTAAQEFGPALFSLRYQDREWLDSAFPEAKPKSWWNPWLGGAGIEMRGISNRSMLTEPRTIRITSMHDSIGNMWQGIQFEIVMASHEKYKGLTIRHNLLTLPGLAGICSVIELEHSGLTVNDVLCLNEVFFTPGGAVEGSWADVTSRQGDTVRYKFGAGTESSAVKKILFGSDNCPEKLMMFSAVDMTVYTNKEVILGGSWDKVDVIPGKKLRTLPVFFLFTAEDLPANSLETLKKIRF